MCLIIASPTGKRIDDAILKDAERTNRDGGGVAWLEKDRNLIEFRKGLTADEIHKVLQSDADGKPWVAHFRIATVGGVRDELTHPFSIDEHASVALSGNAPAVLFHNGGFHNWKEYLLQAVSGTGLKIPPGPWSDSRGIAYICHIYGKYIISLLDSASRWLVFDSSEPEESRMMLWGDWSSHGDFKFSNRGSCVFDHKSAHGGGHSNFPTPASAKNEEKSSAAGNQSDTTSTRNSMSPVKGTGGIENGEQNIRRKERKRFAASAKYDPWKSFSEEGLVIRADNEPAHVT